MKLTLALDRAGGLHELDGDELAGGGEYPTVDRPEPALPDPVGGGEGGGGFAEEREREPPELRRRRRQWRGGGGAAAGELPVEKGDQDEERESTAGGSGDRRQDAGGVLGWRRRWKGRRWLPGWHSCKKREK